MPKRRHSRLGWCIQATRTRAHIVGKSGISVVAHSSKLLQYLTPATSVSLTKEILSTEGSYFAHLRRSLSPCTRGISQSEKQEHLVSIRLHRTPKMNVGANSRIHRVEILRMFIAHCFRIARDRSRHSLNPSVRYRR